eukprot:2009695-Pyramimonas_sp.AAC.1
MCIRDSSRSGCSAPPSPPPRAVVRLKRCCSSASLSPATSRFEGSEGRGRSAATVLDESRGSRVSVSVGVGSRRAREYWLTNCDWSVDAAYSY